MSLLEHYRAMARYNRWMNAKVYDAAAALSDEQRKRELGAFFGSVHGTLNHLVLTDRAWLGRFTGDRDRFTSYDREGNAIRIESLAQILYDDFDELRQQRARTDDDIDEWVASLDEAALGAPLRYKTSQGEPFEHPLWQAASHFFNHQTHHRGQTTTLLTQLGVDVGVTDLVALLRDVG